MSANRHTSILAVLALATVMSGCAGLLVRKTDSGGTKVAKITARTALGLVSLGTSEIAMDDVKKNDQLRQFYRFLEASVGSMTLDAAVSRWGVPESRYEGDQLSVLQWSSQSQSTMVVPISGMWVAAPINHGWNLRLSFNSSTRRLASWNYQQW